MKNFLFIIFAICGLAKGVSTHDVEGIFDITLVCEDRINPNCTELNRKARLAVIKTPDVLSVAVGYPEQSMSRYIFVNHETELKNGHYYGSPSIKNSSVSAHFSEVLLDFSIENDTIQVRGTIRDARFLTDIRISGQQVYPFSIFTPKEIYSDTFDSPETTEGKFHVVGHSRQWLATIRKALSPADGPNYLVEMTDLGSPDKTEAPSGDRIYLRSMTSQQKGILELFAPLSFPGTFVKWMIWATPETLFRSKKLEGFFYSSNGVFSRLEIHRLDNP